MNHPTRWKRNAKDLVERALVENSNGLTVKELSEITGLKEDTIYKVLKRENYPYKGYRDGKRVYLHPKYKLIQELKTIVPNIAKKHLKKSHEEFVKSCAIAIHPFMNKIIAFDTLVSEITEHVLEEVFRNKYYDKNKDLISTHLTEEEIRQVVKKMLEEKLSELNEYIKEHGFRIRIGGIDLF